MVGGAGLCNAISAEKTPQTSAKSNSIVKSLQIHTRGNLTAHHVFSLNVWAILALLDCLYLAEVRTPDQLDTCAYKETLHYSSTA